MVKNVFASRVFRRDEAIARPQSADADDVLLQRFLAQKDGAAFEALVRRHGSMVLSVCRRVTGHSQDAEDAFQAVFLVLVRKGESIRHAKRLASWLYGVAYRTSLEARNRRARRRQLEKQVELMAQPSVQPVTPGLSELRDVIDDELSRLPDHYRLTIVLCDLEGKSRKEAALALDLPIGTISSRLAAGRRILGRRLHRRGLGATYAGLAALLAESRSLAVPAALLQMTVRSAAQVAVGAPTTLVTTVTVAALTEGVLNAMFLAKLKSSCFAWIAVSILLGIMSFAAYAHWNQESIEPNPLAVDGKPNSARGEGKLPAGAVARLGSVQPYHPGGVSWMRHTSDGKEIVTAGYDGTIRFWNPDTGQQTKILGEPKVAAEFPQANEAVHFAVSRDGKWLAVSNRFKGPCRLWNVQKSEEAGTFGEEQFSPHGYGFAVNSDGTRVAACDNSGKVLLYDPAKPEKALMTLAGHEGRCCCMQFTPDGKGLLTGGSDASIRLWTDLDKAEPTVVEVGRHRAAVTSIALSADAKRLVSGGTDGLVRVWDLQAKKQLVAVDMERNLFGPAAPASLVVSADGKKFAVDAQNGPFRVYDAETGKVLFSHSPMYGYINTINTGNLSPDGATVALLNRFGAIRLHDLQKDQPVKAGDGHENGATVAVVSPDGKWIASGGADAAVRLWSVADKKQVRVLKGHVAQIGQLQFSPDSRLLFSASSDFTDQTVSVWDVTTGKELAPFQTQDRYTNSAMAVSPNGKLIAIMGPESGVRIQEFDTRKEMTRLKDVFVEAMFFTGDSRHLVYLSRDRQTGARGMYRTSIADGQVIALSKIPVGQSRPSGHSADGRYAVLTDAGGIPRVLDLESGLDHRELGNKAEFAGAIVIGTHGFSRGNYAVAGPAANDGVCVWELATGKERLRFGGHKGAVTSAAFTPDGKQLVTSSMDSTVMVWDLRAAREKAGLQAPDTLWKALADEDAAKAYAAMQQLFADPKAAFGLISERLKPTPRADAKKIEQFVRDLDSEDFKIRKQAYDHLEKLGPLAQPYLQKALDAKPSLDIVQRIDELMGKIRAKALTSEQLRAIRCVEVLEQLAGSDAQAILKQLADGEPGDLVTQAAKQAHERLGSLEDRKRSEK